MVGFFKNTYQTYPVDSGSSFNEDCSFLYQPILLGDPIQEGGRLLEDLLYSHHIKFGTIWWCVPYIRSCPFACMKWHVVIGLWLLVGLILSYHVRKQAYICLLVQKKIMHMNRKKGAVSPPLFYRVFGILFFFLSLSRWMGRTKI